MSTRTQVCLSVVALLAISACSAPEPSLPVESAPLDSLPIEAIWAGAVASPSPDGRYLYTRDDWADLLRIGVDDRQIMPLTDARQGDRYGGGVLGRVAVSTDGQRVAFFWASRSEEELQVRVVDVDGSGDISRCGSPNGARWVAWNREGDGLLVLGWGGGPNAAAVVELAIPSCEERRRLSWTTPVRPEAEGDRGVGNPHVSSDRTRVVYTGGDDLWAIELDPGAEPNLLLSHFGNTEAPTWSPDGQWVLFTSNIRGTRDLFAIPVEGVRAAGEPRRLRSDIGWTGSGQFNRNGDFLFFSTDFWDHALTVDLDPVTLEVVGTPEPVPDPGAWRTRRPVWSPDGSHMAFISDLYEPYWYPKLMVRDESTDEVKTLIEGEDLISDWYQTPTWTPEGDRVVMRGAEGQFLLLGPDPGESAEVAAECLPRDPSFQVVGWLDAETVLLHWSPSSEGITVRACDLTAGVGRDLLHLPGGRVNLALSPSRADLVFWLASDGRFSWEQPTVFDLQAADPMSSGRRLQFFDEVERPSEFYPGPRTNAWSRDGQELLVATFQVEDGGGHAYIEQDGYDRPTLSRLWALPIDGSSVRALGDVTTESGMMGIGIEWLSLHPARPSLLFTAGSKHQETRVIRGLAGFLDRIDVR